VTGPSIISEISTPKGSLASFTKKIKVAVKHGESQKKAMQHGNATINSLFKDQKATMPIVTLFKLEPNTVHYMNIVLEFARGIGGGVDSTHRVPRSWLFWLSGFRVPSSGSGSGSGCHWLDPGALRSALLAFLALWLPRSALWLWLWLSLAGPGKTNIGPRTSSGSGSDYGPGRSDSDYGPGPGPGSGSGCDSGSASAFGSGPGSGSSSGYNLQRRLSGV
jgi:hypothetical protein